MHTVVQRRTTYKVSFLGGRVPLDLRFRGPLEAKSFVRAPKIDPPGAPGGSLILNAHLVVVTAAVRSSFVGRVGIANLESVYGADFR